MLTPDHGWYKWRRGPVPVDDKMTQAVNIFDLLLLSVESRPGTDEFLWRESRPCSEKNTRVLGTKTIALFIVTPVIFHFSCANC